MAVIQSVGVTPAALRVGDVMSDHVMTIKSSDDCRLAAQMMLWGGHRHLPVVDGERVVGIVTDGDIHRARAERNLEAHTTVAAIMSTPVETASPTDPLAPAAGRMVDARIDCLPVVEDGHLVGILTATDVLASTARSWWPRSEGGRALVRDVMHGDVRVASPDTSLSDAIALMVEHGIRHLPVVDERRVLVGMVTDRDVRTLIGDPLTALCDGPCGPAADLTVEDAMSQNPATAYIDDPLSTLSWSLVDERLGAVPVLDDQRRVVGIVSYVDVLQAALAR